MSVKRGTNLIAMNRVQRAYPLMAAYTVYK